MTENYDEEMSEQERVQHFADDLDSLIERYRQEYDIMLTSVVGVLTLQVHYLLSDVYHKDAEDEDEEQEDDVS